MAYELQKELRDARFAGLLNDLEETEFLVLWIMCETKATGRVVSIGEKELMKLTRRDRSTVSRRIQALIEKECIQRVGRWSPGRTSRYEILSLKTRHVVSVQHEHVVSVQHEHVASHVANPPSHVAKPPSHVAKPPSTCCTDDTYPVVVPVVSYPVVVPEKTCVRARARDLPERSMENFDVIYRFYGAPQRLMNEQQRLYMITNLNAFLQRPPDDPLKQLNHLTKKRTRKNPQSNPQLRKGTPVTDTNNDADLRPFPSQPKPSTETAWLIQPGGDGLCCWCCDEEAEDWQLMFRKVGDSGRWLCLKCVSHVVHSQRRRHHRCGYPDG